MGLVWMQCNIIVYTEVSLPKKKQHTMNCIFCLKVGWGGIMELEASNWEVNKGCSHRRTFWVASEILAKASNSTLVWKAQIDSFHQIMGGVMVVTAAVGY